MSEAFSKIASLSVISKTEMLQEGKLNPYLLSIHFPHFFSGSISPLPMLKEAQGSLNYRNTLHTSSHANDVLQVFLWYF